MTLTLGQTFSAMPIPADPSLTTYFEAGQVTIGVEIRGVDGDFVTDQYADATPEQRAEIEAFKPEVPDSGVSLHVFSADGVEHLRFDCFDEQPHYHYIDWGKGEHLYVPFDEVANGSMATWALRCLTERLPEMLRAAGAVDLAEAVDASALEDVLPDLRRACEEQTTSADAST